MRISLGPHTRRLLIGAAPVVALVAIGSTVAFAWETPQVTGTCVKGQSGFDLVITTNDAAFSSGLPQSEYTLTITDTTTNTSTNKVWAYNADGNNDNVIFDQQIPGSTTDKWTVSFPGILVNNKPQTNLQNIPIDLSGCKCSPSPSPSPSASPSPSPSPSPKPSPSASPTASPTPTPGGGGGAGTPTLPDTGFGG